jgi:putative transposase
LQGGSRQGDDLTGPDGLLKTITKQVIEAALEEEMTEHVGYDKHAVEGRNGAQLAATGTRVQDGVDGQRRPGQVEVPRDRDGTLRTGDRQEAATPPERCGRDRALAVRARVDHRRDQCALRETYGASVSKDTVSRITDKVIELPPAWTCRPGPLDPCSSVYAAIFIDAIYVKVRDGQVGNQPFYAAIGGRPARTPRRARTVWPGTVVGASPRSTG